MKNKTTAALLAFFLGAFGAQWFYLGKSGKGLTYLLVCWALCWTIVAPVIICILCLIEFIKFLTMSEAEFDSMYNAGVSMPAYHSYSQPQPSAPQVSSFSNASSDTSSKAESLMKLKSLLDSGVLTQEEFEAQKRKILNQ